jgi:hypothetical protein
MKHSPRIESKENLRECRLFIQNVRSSGLSAIGVHGNGLREDEFVPMGGNKKKHIDPLFQLFEHYLLNRSYEDSTAFTKEIAEEYVSYLDSTPAHVPFHVRTNLLEDLEGEAHEMLVKKMYGCVRLSDYMNYGKVIVENGDELDTFDFSPPTPGEENTKKS